MTEPFLRILHVGGRGDTIGPGMVLLHTMGKDTELIVTEADADTKDAGLGAFYTYGAIWRTLPYCLSNKVGKADFHINAFPDCSSLYHMAPEAALYHRDQFVWGKICMTDRIVQVETTTIDTLLSKGEIASPHFLSLDAQGAELSIMKGAKSLFEGKDLIGVVTEVEFRPLYEGQPLFTDQDIWLRSYGFQLCQFFNPEYWFAVPYYPKGKGFLIVAEALYLRDYRHFMHDPANIPALARLVAMANAFDMPSYSWDILKYAENTWPQEWEAFLKPSYLQEVIEELKR